MEFVIFCGSVRKQNITKNFCKLIQEAVLKLGHQATIVELNKIPIEYFGDPFPQTAVEKITTAIKKSAGVILVTPEYDGSYSSVLKGMIENLGYPSPLQYKPVSLVGVAAGGIGAIKALEHLKGVCSHIGAIVLPYSCSFANINSSFDEQANLVDMKIKDQLESLTKQHIAYLENSLGY